MFDFLKVFNKKEKIEPKATDAPADSKPQKPKKPKETKTPSPKDLATQNGEPYINIISLEVDPNNINSGSFELDWNDKFVLNLIRAGYKMRNDDTEQIIVDRWFQTVCRNIALEVYEQEIADPQKRNDIRIIQQKDIGNGRTEVS
jgi:hypothetical protein